MGVNIEVGQLGIYKYLRGRSKSKLLILSEYVNKTEKTGGTWTNTNRYRENEAWSIVWYFDYTMVNQSDDYVNITL